MTPRGRPASALVARAAVVALVAASPAPARAQPLEDAVARGRAVFEASGGCSCHTDFDGGGEDMAGGRPIRTPFGVFYSTNITSDPDTGIGRWSDSDFLRAMREGRAPDGSAYFPVFPYTSFTGMSDDDALALKAYLFSLRPVAQANRAPEVPPPFSWRIAARAWQWLHFAPRRFQPDPARPRGWNRGAYLVEAVAHCGECHTPRTFMGATDEDLHYAGSTEGPEGELAPNITPDEKTGIGKWSTTDIVWFLQTNLLPDGDGTQGLMAEVIDKGYRHMEEADLKAIAVYLESLPPIENEVKKK